MNRHGEPGCCLTFILMGVIAATLTGLGFSENASLGIALLLSLFAAPFAIAYFRARAAQTGAAHAPSAPLPPTRPGWHPDPTGRYPYRYWDGQRWTDAVSTGTTNGVDPL